MFCAAVVIRYAFRCNRISIYLKGDIMNNLLIALLPKCFSIFCIYCILQLNVFNSIFAANSTKPNITGPGGIQVNSFTGNLFYQRSDLSIPGRGVSIDISFFYNSGQTTVDNGYGNGWSFSYNMYYYFDASDVIIKKSDGSKDKYTWNGSSYEPPTGVFDVLEEYQSNKFRLTTKYGLKYFFDESSHKKLTKIEDPNGNAIAISYTNGFPTTVTDPTARSLTLTWTDDHLTQITNANVTPSRSITYNYDANGNQVRVTDPIGNTVDYGYGAWCNITSFTDGRGNTVNITFNANKAVSGISTSITNKTIAYDTENKQTSVTEEVSSGNQTTTYTFDDNGRFVKLTDPSGQFVSYEYDSDDNITKYTDAKSNITTYTFDAKGNKLTETDAIGTKTYTYETNFNKVASVQDKNGNTTLYTYDSNGNLTGISKPLGVSESYSYDSYGNMTGFTDGNGNTTSYSYDTHGNIIGINYPIGSESFTYDNAGNRLSYTNANGNTSNYTYDKLNRLTSASDPLSHSTTYVYDANGNMTSLTDANSNTTTYTYDILNRLTGVTTPTGSTGYTYDQAGNLKSLQDANGHTSTYNYNSKNLLSSETDALSNSTSYTYDYNGNLLSRTDANGNITNYTYDAANRLTGKSYSGNSDSYGYDSEGNLTSALNNNISITYTYDALIRLTNKTVTTWGKSISYTYDNEGNRLTMTDPDGGVTNYTYDSNNRLTVLQNPLSQTTTFTYDNGGRVTRQDNANGTYATYSYDNTDRLISLINRNSSNIVLTSYSYTYDNKGNRISMTDKDAGVNNYTYDNTDQVTGVSYSDGSSESFTYDSWGNRTQLIKDGITTNYTYDSADRILTAGSTAYTFDNNGNLTGKIVGVDTTTYNYDGENRLTQVTLPNAKTNTFSYSPSGLRISKTDTTGEVVKYFYDGVNAIMELDNAGTTNDRYTVGLDIDQWISIDRDGNSYFYYKDALGSITGLTDESETIVKTYDYDVFGEIKNETGTLINPYCFMGKDYDDEIYLYYYRIRYYSQNLGRFYTKDPLGAINYMSCYSYPHNNPININDMMGLGEKITPWIAKKLKESFIDRTSKYLKNKFLTDADAYDYIEKKYKQIKNAKKVFDDLRKNKNTKLGPDDLKNMKDIFDFSRTFVPDVPGIKDYLDFTGKAMEAITEQLEQIEKDMTNPWSFGGWRTWVDDAITGGPQDGPQGGGGPDPLPVELSTFSALLDDGLVTLQWRTETELNCYSFDIYKALDIDGKYEKINSELIPGAGNSNAPHDYTYIDSTVTAGLTYYYKIKQIDFDGTYEWYGPISATMEEDNIPSNYALFQNHPNPFNPVTTIRIAIPENTDVKLLVFNILGEKVKTLIDKNMEAGYHDIEFYAGDMSSGVYVYRLVAGKFCKERKMIFLK